MERIFFFAGMALIVISVCHSLFKAIQEGGRWVVICFLSGSIAYAIHCWKEDKTPLILGLTGIASVTLSMFLSP